MTAFSKGQRVKISPSPKWRDPYRGKIGTVLVVKDNNGPLAEMYGLSLKGEAKTLWFWGYELREVKNVEQ